MEIKDFKNGDEYKIFELFALTFGRPMKPEYWYWRFQNNPAGKHLIKLMWDGNKLVGHYAVSPVRMRVKDEVVLSTLSMTTMTHPEYGRRGIFGSLADSLYSDLENTKNIKAIWGFPNNNSHYGFIKKLRWKDLSVLNHLVMDISDFNTQLSDKIKLVENFNKVHSLIMEDITKDYDVCIDRSVEYLNWRYIDNPNVKYSIFEYVENEQILGFLVVKNYFNQESQTHNLFIMECGIPFKRIEILSEFIGHLLASYQEDIVSINIWLPLRDSRHIYFEKNGFCIGGKPTYFGVRAKIERSNLINNFENWYYSYGDSDVY